MIFPRENQTMYFRNCASIKNFYTNKNSHLKYSIFDFGYDEEPRKPRLRPIKGYFPIGVNQLGEVVFFPKNKVSQGILITGMRGSGKTLLGHLILENMFYMFRRRVCAINDYLGEMPYWALPSSSHKFNRINDAFNLKPKPMPIVPLVPGEFEQSEIRKTFYRLRVALPIQELIKKIDNFIDLGGSSKYFEEINFAGVKTKEDLFRVIEEHIDDTKTGIKIKAKIKADINKLEKRKLIANEKGIVNYLSIKNTYGLPHLRLLTYNFIPAFYTSNIQKEAWFPYYLSFIIDSLIDYQKVNRSTMAHKKLVIDIEELSSILNLKKVDDAIRSIKTLYLQGRNYDIDVISRLQNFPKESYDWITSNSGFLFCFHSSSRDDNTQAKRRMNVSNSKNILKHLKTFECWGYSEDDKFLICNTLTNKQRRVNGPIKFKIIPPLSHHYHSEHGKLTHNNNKDFANRNIYNYVRWLIKKDKLGFRDETGEYIFNQRAEMNYNFRVINRYACLIEGIDYGKMVYNKKTPFIFNMEYDTLKERGFFICKDLRTNLFFIRDPKKFKSGIEVYQDIPKNILHIKYDYLKQKVWLEGNNTKLVRNKLGKDNPEMIYIGDINGE